MTDVTCDMCHPVKSVTPQDPGTPATQGDPVTTESGRGYPWVRLCKTTHRFGTPVPHTGIIPTIPGHLQHPSPHSCSAGKLGTPLAHPVTSRPLLVPLEEWLWCSSAAPVPAPVTLGVLGGFWVPVSFYWCQAISRPVAALRSSCGLPVASPWILWALVGWVLGLMVATGM